MLPVMAHERTPHHAGPRTRKLEATLRAHGLAYPETHEDFPWGERVLKVKGKVFVFLWADENGLSITTKLARSHHLALSLPNAKPTGYGLGKSGWVSAKFTEREGAPVDMLCEWIDESYRTIAPKRLVASLDDPSRSAKRSPPRTKASSTRGATKAASSTKRKTAPHKVESRAKARKAKALGPKTARSSSSRSGA